jgi:hypothetical protein
MKRSGFILAVLVCWLGLAGTIEAQESQPGWRPERTWLFVVGILQFKHGEMFGSFPQKGRRDAEVVDFFKSAGVPAGQVVYLTDKEATQERIETAFPVELKKMRPGDLLLLYYAGHGYKATDGSDTYLAPYDAGDERVSGWSVHRIPKVIEQYAPKTSVLWLIDCCYSGAAADVIRQRKGPNSYGCVTSSAASEVSTGHWTFSDALLDALHGAAFVDLNHDGHTTLSEFAKHVDRDMTLGEEQVSSFAVSGGFNTEMVLANAKPLENSRIGERVDVESQGTWYPARIIQVQGPEFTVHFIGYDSTDDVRVTGKQMRAIKPVQYPVGAKVEVLWKKTWYPATVLSVKDGVHYVHYDDYGNEWDEWASSKRVRKAGSR